jgi:hypothetical protein
VQDAAKIRIGWVLSIPALAAEAGSEPVPAEEKPLAWVGSDAYPPFTDITLPQQGMLTEVVRSVFQALGKPPDLVFWERQSSLHATHAGTFAATFPHPRSVDQQSRFLASRPLYHGVSRAFVRSTGAPTFPRLADPIGLSVCYPAGFAPEKIQMLVTQQRMTEKTPKTLDACFVLLAQGKVDVVVAEELWGQGVLRSMELADGVCMLEEAVGTETMHVLFPRAAAQSETLLQAFDGALEQLESSGKVQEIRSRSLQAYRDAAHTPPTWCTAAQSPVVASSDTKPSPFQPQPGEFLALVPPRRPPQELALVSMPTSESPTVDGRATEAFWQTAPAITTLDYASQRPITLKSVHTDEEIFLLVTYPDQAPSETHRSWGWDAKEGVYKPLGDREDVLVLKWSMVGNQVSLSFRDAQPHRADIWYWKALRTNPMGYADDKMQFLRQEAQKDAVTVPSPAHGTLYLIRPGDEGEPAFEEKIFYAYQEDVLPRFYPQQPQGSRADVRAKGVWHQGVWTIELQRQLNTGHADDIAFAPGGTYLFAISCYEMAYGRVEPEITQPLYKLGDAFDRLLLKIARGNEG